jgi:hypothetical protein
MPPLDPPKRRVRSRGAIATSALATVVLCGACAGSSSPCRVPLDCTATQECLANQCRAVGSLPVSPTSARRVLLPQLYRLGGDPSHAALDLQFVLPSLASPVVAAFLVLPTSSTPRMPQRVLELELRLLIDPWTAHVQRVGVASARAIVSEGATARLDVTELVQTWLGRPSAGNGLRITARDSSGMTVPFDQEVATGARLELYAAGVDAISERPR